MDDNRILITGANGQLGQALRAKYPKARAVGSSELDITDQTSLKTFDWSGIEVVLNAAAYTNVDGAESAEGRVAAWKVNGAAVGYLAEVARKHEMTLVHISTDFVFDGSQDPHTEDEPLSPLSVYGASKAAGDLLAASVPKHYLVRTSWVIGEGKNFVRIMLGLGQKGVNPGVIHDHTGRLTFTSTLVEAIHHLLTKQAPYGTYNVSNEGEPGSWADVTRVIFSVAGLPNTVTNITNAEYYSDKPGSALRPLRSTLDLRKIQATGFSAPDWREDLEAYIKKEIS